MLRSFFNYALLLAWISLLPGCNSKTPVQLVDPNNRICFDLQTPHPGWTLSIQEVRLDGTEHLHVYVEAKTPEQQGMSFSTVISSATGCVNVPRDGREMTTYISGATWNWLPENIIKVASIEEYRSITSKNKPKTLFPGKGN